MLFPKFIGLVGETLLNFYFWSVSIVSLLVTFPICLVLSPFVSQKTVARLYESIPGWTVYLCMTLPGFWKVQIKDYRKAPTWKENYVVIANHLSYCDSFFMAVAIPLKKKFMIGEIFTKIPVFGWLSLLSGHVPVDRNNRTLCSTAVERAFITIKRDSSSFCIYPEGMREKFPYIFEPFKTGAYRIAFRTGLQILPVTMVGTHKVMSFRGWVRPGKVTVCIDEPFHVQSIENKCKDYVIASQAIFTERIMENAK